MQYLPHRFVLAGLLAAAACGGGSAAPQPDGAPKLGIIAGNNQTVLAGAARLADPVIGQLVRLPSGQVAWQRVLEPLLPPKAYAQGTVVNGSPIPGAVVCAVSTTEGGLVPFTPCTNTDTAGKAIFFFTPGTRAGDAKSEIRGTLAGEPAVFDTAKATVMAGPASLTYRTQTTPISTFPVAVPATSVQDQYGNAVPFRIVSDGRIVVQDTTTGSVGARTIVSAPDASADFVVELHSVNDALVGRARYRVNAGTLLTWIAAGVNATP